MKKILYTLTIVFGMLFAPEAIAQKTNDHGGSKERQVQKKVKKKFDADTKTASKKVETTKQTKQNVQSKSNKTSAQAKKSASSAVSKGSKKAATARESVKKQTKKSLASKNPTQARILSILEKIQKATQKLNKLKSAGKISKDLFAAKTSALRAVKNQLLQLQSNNESLLSVIAD